jgi:hypothetical protein
MSGGGGGGVGALGGGWRVAAAPGAGAMPQTSQ